MEKLSEQYNPYEGAARLLSGIPKSLEDRGRVLDATGWKIARIVSPIEGRFAGLAFGEYGMIENALCAKVKTHKAPAIGCECGFHALNERGSAIGLLAGRRSGYVLLKVELYGTLVMHRDGIRGNEQDVIEIQLPAFCSRLFCRRETVALVKKGKRWLPACILHSGAGGVSMTEMHVALGVDVRTIVN
jgi:hypothetical protein